MESQLKVNEIIKQSGSSITIGENGDTVSGPFTMVPAFEAYLGSDQTITDTVTTKVQFNTEVYDTDNCYDNSTNYRFTPTVAGKYFIYGSIKLQCETNDTVTDASIYLYKNGSPIRRLIAIFTSSNPITTCNPIINEIVDLNGSSDYVELFGNMNVSSGTPRFDAGDQSTFFGAYRITGA